MGEAGNIRWQRVESIGVGGDLRRRSGWTGQGQSNGGTERIVSTTGYAAGGGMLIFCAPSIGSDAFDVLLRHRREQGSLLG